MASTPPAQIRGEPRTPPTPLHGSAYHSNSPSSRYFTRSSRKTPDSAPSSFTRSPRSSRQQTDLYCRSPEEEASVTNTPRRKATPRRAPMISPASPNSESSDHPQPKPSFIAANTLFTEGMLPTPAKTPQKKQLAKSTMAARVLFQDIPVTDSPRKSQKKRARQNGFTLESFEESSNAQDSIPIHVDSRDQVPTLDTSTDNPFYEAPATFAKKRAAPSSTQKVSVTKRRKVSHEKPSLDPQVQNAIDKDEGMVYVFRGKKVYRRFDDAGDEEEVIDPEELGLLEHTSEGAEIVKPLRTLTRKSIKPRKLFDTPTPNRRSKRSQVSEEIETDIDDEVEDQSSPTRASRSHAVPGVESAVTGIKRKRGSPFDKWPRLKSGSRSASGGTVTGGSSRGRKRNAAEALDV